MEIAYVSDSVPAIKNSRMRFWSHAGKVGIPIEYDGVPFVHVGRWSLLCHQGKDIAAKAKQRYFERKAQILVKNSSLSNISRRTTTKKVNCPAEVYVSHIVKYPQFRVPKSSAKENLMPTEHIRRGIKDKIRTKNPSKIVHQHCYIVRLPDVSDHSGHPCVASAAVIRDRPAVSNISTFDRKVTNKNRDKYRRTKEPLDVRVALKLEEIIKGGIYSTSEIKSELNKYVIDDLFNSRPPPPAMFRRYNPTSRDIYNTFKRLKQKAYIYRCEEIRTHCVNIITNISKSLPKIGDEEVLTDIYEKLLKVSQHYSLSSVFEHSGDASVTLHTINSEEECEDNLIIEIDETPKLENEDQALNHSIKYCKESTSMSNNDASVLDDACNENISLIF